MHEDNPATSFDIQSKNQNHPHFVHVSTSYPLASDTDWTTVGAEQN